MTGYVSGQALPEKLVHRIAEGVAGRAMWTPDEMVEWLDRCLFEMDLAVVSREQAKTHAAVDEPGHQPRMVSMAFLFERAATLVDGHLFTPATVLLGVVADVSPSALLSAYRALVDVLEQFDSTPPIVSSAKDSAWQIESDLRTQVFDLLARGPDAPQPTGKETF